jgi:hypothetical protein
VQNEVALVEEALQAIESKSSLRRLGMTMRTVRRVARRGTANCGSPVALCVHVVRRTPSRMDGVCSTRAAQYHKHLEQNPSLPPAGAKPVHTDQRAPPQANALARHTDVLASAIKTESTCLATKIPPRPASASAAARGRACAFDGGGRRLTPTSRAAAGAATPSAIRPPPRTRRSSRARSAARPAPAAEARLAEGALQARYLAPASADANAHGGRPAGAAAAAAAAAQRL